MKSIGKSAGNYEQAPVWVERTIPRNVVLADAPSVLLIKIHVDGCWVVASRLASDIVANPNSHLGNFMRTHCALLAMRHVSSN